MSQLTHVTDAHKDITVTSIWSPNSIPVDYKGLPNGLDPDMYIPRQTTLDGDVYLKTALTKYINIIATRIVASLVDGSLMTKSDLLKIAPKRVTPDADMYLVTRQTIVKDGHYRIAFYKVIVFDALFDDVLSYSDTEIKLLDIDRIIDEKIKALCNEAEQILTKLNTGALIGNSVDSQGYREVWCDGNIAVPHWVIPVHQTTEGKNNDSNVI